MERKAPPPGAVALIQASMIEPPAVPAPRGAPPWLPLGGRQLRLLGGRPALAHLIERLRQASAVHQVVALSLVPEDDALMAMARSAGVPVFCGSLHDISGRLTDCIDWFGLGDAAALVRVSVDSPLLDPRYLDVGLAALASTGADAFEFLEDQAERHRPTLPFGCAVGWRQR